MGSPTIYWTPAGSTTLRTISLASVSEVRGETVAVGSRLFSVVGAAASVMRGQVHAVTIVATLDASDAAAIRRLEQLRSHLLAGRTIGFSVDHSKTWASTFSAMTVDDTAIGGTSNLFTAWSGSAVSPAVGAEVAFDPDPGTQTYEVADIGTAFTLGLGATGDPVAYDHTGDMLVRWRDFWPALRLPDLTTTGIFETTKHRLTYEVEMRLIYDPAEAVAIYTALGA